MATKYIVNGVIYEDAEDGLKLIVGSGLVEDQPSAGGTPTDSLSASNVSSQVTLGSPTLTQQHGLTAAPVASQSELSSVSLGGLHALTATSLSISSSTQAATIGQTHALLAVALDVATVVSNPTVTDIPAAVDALSATNLSIATQVASGTLGQNHSLSSVALSVGTSVSTPTVTDIDVTDDLIAEGIQSGTSVSTSTLSQLHALVADSISTTTSVSVPSTGGAYGYRVDGGLAKTIPPNTAYTLYFHGSGYHSLGYDEVTSTTTYTWTEYVENWSTQPTLTGTTPGGDEVWQYTYNNGTLYRLVPGTGSPEVDSFYSTWDGTNVSDLVISRGMNI